MRRLPRSTGKEIAVMASPRPTRYAPRSQAFSPCRGSDLGSARKPGGRGSCDQVGRVESEPIVAKSVAAVVFASDLRSRSPSGTEFLMDLRPVAHPVRGGIDSSTPAGRMMIGVLGSLAEYERELTKERTALKGQASRANGTKFGRPRKVDDSEHIAAAKRMKQDGHGQGDRQVPRRQPSHPLPVPRQRSRLASPHKRL